MNMIDIQDKLKNLSEDQLIREMQAPTGQAPQFLVLSEITRRKKMRDSFKAQEAKQGMPTVAEEVVASAAVPQQGLPQMASAMAPKSSIAQNTGIGSLPVQGMYAGGPVKKMAAGGKVVVRNGVRYVQQPDGTFVTETQARTLTPMQDIQNFGQMLADLPATAGNALANYSAGIAGDMNASLAATGDAAMRRQMAEDVYGMRAGPDTSYRYPEFPAVDTSAMDRVAMALEGRSGFPTGMPTPQQLAMAAAQPSLPPAPLPAFGPDFEYGGRGPQIDLDLVDLNADRAAAMQAGQDASMLGMVAPIGMPPDVGAGRSGFPTMTSITPAAGTPFPAAPVPPGPGFEDVGRGAPVMPQEIPQGYGDAIMAPRIREGLPVINNEEGAAFGETLRRGIQTMANPVGSAIGTVMDYLQGSPEETGGRADRDQQGLEDEDATGLPPDAPQGGAEPPIQGPSAVVAGAGTGGTGSASTGASAGSGKGGYISELEAALQRAERTKEQDKWLALAQAGLALMASDQPTLGGAIGEAGQVGIEAFRGARDEYEQSRMSIMEAIAAQKAAAAKAAGGGGGGGRGGTSGIDAVLKSLNSDLEGIMTEATTYDDQGNEVTTYVPLQGYEDTAAQLSAMRDKLLRERYGLNNFDARQ